jgi:hypothetical protein
MVCTNGDIAIGTLTRREVTKFVAQLTRLAEELRDATRLVGDDRQLMLDAAQALETRAGVWAAYRGPWVTERKRGDPFVRAYALALTDRFVAILGKPCTLLVARIISAVFDCELDERTLRSWRTGR